MTLAKAKNSFRFVTQLNLIQLTGLKARNLQELLAYLKQAPPSIIYHHTHHFLKQHQYLSPEPPNDFAYWVTQILREQRLGEQLAAIDTVRFNSIHSMAEKIIYVIETYLAQGYVGHSAPAGEELHLMKSQSFLFPTPYVAFDLSEFLDCIGKISLHSLYHHMFEARIRLGRETNDFSNWLDRELSETQLAKAIARLDPYTLTLEDLRLTLVRLLESRIAQLDKEPLHAA